MFGGGGGGRDGLESYRSPPSSGENFLALRSSALGGDSDESVSCD